MRAFIKSLGFVFLAILFAQLLTLPSYTTVRQRDAYEWPRTNRIISSMVAVRSHQNGVVKGFIVSSDGRTVTPFSAPDAALRGPASVELRQYDRMTARRGTLLWSIPVNLALIILGFMFTDFWEKRHPAPGRAFSAAQTTPDADSRAGLSLKLEHARLKRDDKPSPPEDGPRG